MHGDYRNRYLEALLDDLAARRAMQTHGLIGEIRADTARLPHEAAFYVIDRSWYLGTTIGVGALTAPLPASDGFQYFELCAMTS